jgi:hypothetical protein
VPLVERLVRLAIAALCVAALVLLELRKVELPAAETGLLGGVGSFALPPRKRDGELSLAERLVRLLAAAGAIAAIIGLAIGEVKVSPLAGGMLGGVAAFALPPGLALSAIRRHKKPDEARQ